MYSAVSSAAVSSFCFILCEIKKKFCIDHLSLLILRPKSFPWCFYSCEIFRIVSKICSCTRTNTSLIYIIFSMNKIWFLQNVYISLYNCNSIVKPLLHLSSVPNFPHSKKKIIYSETNNVLQPQQVQLSPSQKTVNNPGTGFIELAYVNLWASAQSLLVAFTALFNGYFSTRVDWPLGVFAEQLDQ